MEYFNKVVGVCFGMSIHELESKNWSMFSDNPDMLLFFSSTRQYVNMSLALKYVSKEYISDVRIYSIYSMTYFCLLLYCLTIFRSPLFIFVASHMFELKYINMFINKCTPL